MRPVADFAVQAEALAHGGFDVVIEATGAAEALSWALAVIRRGGTIVQVGTLPASVSLPLITQMNRKLTLAGSIRSANVVAISISLTTAGRVDVKPLITSVNPLAETPATMQTATVARTGIKGQVQP